MCRHPDSEPTESTSEQALTTIGSSGGDTSGTGTISTEKPRETHASCMTACNMTHISNGWCTAYCDCRIYYKGAAAACAEHASGMFIDI